MRHPRRIEDWNRVLVIGAHGGQGGLRFDAQGNEVGRDDTALDDVVGDFALRNRFAYASFDRNGLGGTAEAEALTRSFTFLMIDQTKRRLWHEPDHVLLVGLSMGGGIARRSAELKDSPYSGVLAIAGAGGDSVGQILRQIKIAATWSGVDPASHRGIAIEPSRIEAYADAVGTPIGAQRFWPFIAQGATLERVRSRLEGFGYTGLTDDVLLSLDAARLSENEEAFAKLEMEDSDGQPSVPFIEVVGTFDDFVLPEIRSYREKVKQQSAEARHRLYQVEGAWHLSSNDDAVGSFQWVGARMGLEQQSIEAMRTGASYIAVAQSALLHLQKWVGDGIEPPRSQTLGPNDTLE